MFAILIKRIEYKFENSYVIKELALPLIYF